MKSTRTKIICSLLMLPLLATMLFISACDMEDIVDQARDLADQAGQNDGVPVGQDDDPEPDAKPSEVRGEDPETVSVYPGAVRTEHISVPGGARTAYAAPADPEEVIDFYTSELTGQQFAEWSTAAKLHIAAEDVDGHNVIIEIETGESSDWPGYAEFIITWGEDVNI